jgi:2-octaprenyl-6-methoxyphenol hydroxylase
MAKTQLTHYDVIIVGGGPNGLALGLALAQISDFKVLILDGRDPAIFAVSGMDTRGTALTQATLRFFARVGLKPLLAPHLMEIRDVKVTDASGPLSRRASLLNLTTAEDEKSAASMIENRHLATSLVTKISDNKNIALWPNVKITNIEVLPGKARLNLADGRVISACLLVGADGKNSLVRKTAKIDVQSHDHSQTALTFTIRHSKSHDNCAEEHFSPGGVCALLPLPDNRSSIVWAENPEKAEALIQMPEPAFVEALQNHIGDHLGEVTLEGKRNAYPLQLQIAKQLTAPRVALVGDAGHVVHPLAGLGLNIGFKDGATLHHCIDEAIKRGDDFGSHQVLERYAQWRRFDIASTVALLEALNGLFSADNKPTQFLRQLGLRLVDHMPPLKTAIMQHAAGTNMELPKLMNKII